MKKAMVLALVGATAVSGCMTVGKDGHSYVANHVPGTESNSAIKKACSFDNTVIAGAVVGGIALLLGADGNDAAALGAGAALAQNAISQQACSRAQAAASRAMAKTNVRVTWTDPKNRSNHGYSIVEPIKGQSGYGFRKDVVWQNGKQTSSSVRVKQSSSGRWQTV